MDPLLESKTVSVVIPVYNQSHLTRRCLESLFANSLNLKEIFVIDNASQDDTLNVILEFQGRPGPTLTIIPNTQNKGFGRAVNQGLRLSIGSHLVVLNNDTWLMPGWDRALLNEMETAQVDVIVPYFYERPYTDDLPRLAREFVERNHSRRRRHFAAILFMIKREAYEDLQFDHGGLFDERFFVTYEDTDLLERMWVKGIRYAQTGSCFVWHHSMASRSVPGALPPAYEQEGLKIFMEKWGFDPRPRDHTAAAKLKRWWWKQLEKRGRF